MTIVSNAPSTVERTASIEWVTPARAKEFLQRNIANNRKPKQAKITAYARDIVAGNWLFTGEAIKFDVDGNLVDGQNRCMGIIAADMHAEVLVVRGLSKEAVYLLDSGTSRSGADAITISGIADKSDPKDLASTARLHRAYWAGDVPNAMTGSAAFGIFTKSELIEYLRENPRLDFAARYAKTIYSHLRLPVSSLAVAFDTFEQIDREATAEFFNRIKDGVSTGPGDPFLTLSRRVTQDRQAGVRSIAPATGLFYLFRTWNAFRTDESLVKMQIGSKQNGWTPIPFPK